jgi:preprotein translocase subunit YajC
MEPLILVLVLFAFAYLFLILPSRRRQRSHQAMQDSVEVGDEIITAGGIHGIVAEIGDDEIQLEIAEDVVVRVDRRAIAAVARDVPDDEDDDELDEPEDEEPDEPEASGEAEESLKG